MKWMLALFTMTVVSPLFVSCVEAEAERKAVPPPSSASNMPWNTPQRGEGGAQFGGMLERR